MFIPTLGITTLVIIAICILVAYMLLFNRLNNAIMDLEHVEDKISNVSHPTIITGYQTENSNILNNADSFIESLNAYNQLLKVINEAPELISDDMRDRQRTQLLILEDKLKKLDFNESVFFAERNNFLKTSD